MLHAPGLGCLDRLPTDHLSHVSLGWGRSHLSWDVKTSGQYPRRLLPSLSVCLSLQSSKPEPPQPLPGLLDNRQHPRAHGSDSRGTSHSRRGPLPPQKSACWKLSNLEGFAALCSLERGPWWLGSGRPTLTRPLPLPQATLHIQAGLWLLPPLGPAPHKPESPHCGVQRGSCCPRAPRRPAEQ